MKMFVLLITGAVGLIGVLGAVATDRVSWLAVGVFGLACFIVVARDER